MNKNIFFGIICTTLLVSSCGTVKTRTLKTMKIIDTGVIQKQVLVDLIIDENKVTGESIEERGVEIEIAKTNAIYNAMKKSNSDVIIEPIFEISQSFKETKVVVMGYPGKYKNFRPITKEEIPLLELNKDFNSKQIIPIKKGKK
ncbi:MAG: hypothetical protein HYU67_06590 [Flavobacteriia bacterium]|nr:hypothetical protein [Flavobacteriia bacterium]